MPKHSVYIKVRLDLSKRPSKLQKLKLIENTAWAIDKDYDQIAPSGIELKHFFVSKLSRKRSS